MLIAHSSSCSSEPSRQSEVQHREIAAKEIGSELHGQHNRFQRSEARPIQSRSNRQYARTRVKDIQRLIGMLIYFSQYTPDMSTVTAPMRSLLKADVPFVWNTEHERQGDSFHNTWSPPVRPEHESPNTV